MSSVEERIQAALAAGDHRAAATEAIRGLGPKIQGFLLRTLRDEDDAADAFSMWAERVWRSIGDYRGEASFRTWAFKIAWNVHLSVRAEGWRRYGRRFHTGEASALAAEVRTVTAVKVQRQRDELDALRDLLSVEELTLLSLRIDQGLSWDDIALVLTGDGPPPEPATLRKRFERLKDKLSRLARDRGQAG